MRWSEINEAERLWQLPRERTKNGVPHAVPLAPQAWAVIAAQPRLASCDLVFTHDGVRQIGGFSRAKRSLDLRMKSTKPWTLHDARRTCASGMQRLGIRAEVVESASIIRRGAYRGIAGVYQVDPMLDAKRDAFERWATHVNSCAGKPTPKVVRLRGR